jgi:hypothetical protein
MISVLVMSANSSVGDVIPDGKTDCPLINQLTGKQTDEEGAVAICVGIGRRHLRHFETTESGREVNWLTDGRFGQSPGNDQRRAMPKTALRLSQLIATHACVACTTGHS